MSDLFKLSCSRSFYSEKHVLLLREFIVTVGHGGASSTTALYCIITTLLDNLLMPYIPYPIFQYTDFVALLFAILFNWMNNRVMFGLIREWWRKKNNTIKRVLWRDLRRVPKRNVFHWDKVTLVCFFLSFFNLGSIWGCKDRLSVFYSPKTTCNKGVYKMKH